MRKLVIYDGTKTYMYPSGALATPERVLQDSPAILTFPHVIETDEAEQVLGAVDNLSARRSREGIDSSLSNEEAVAVLQDKLNAPPPIPEPSAEDVQASLSALSELEALEDSELKHSSESPVTYTRLQARYANYYVRGLWTKRHIALAVRKGRLTVEQFKDIVGEEFDPEYVANSAPVIMEAALNDLGVETRGDIDGTN